MKTTNEIYEFTPKYATIELMGITHEEAEKLLGKRVTIILRDVWLESADYNFVTLNDTETILEFYGG